MGLLMWLFVYGSLKTGQRNSGRFLAGQTFLGPARTPSRYRLHDCGPFPAMVEAGDGISVRGELWDVSEECLKRIDRLEGVDVGLYERKVIALESPPVEAYVYLFLGSVEGLSDCGSSWGS
jgi:gamma-glutamylcyclotransferase (GGCT)/AIG2-like uncharacterized protein YtfP